jgi:hypothetical protein
MMISPTWQARIRMTWTMENVGSELKGRNSNGNSIEMQLNMVIVGERLKDKGEFLSPHWKKVTGLYSEITSP